MTCATCNGWGVIYSIATTPPSMAAARTSARLKGPSNFMLTETLCLVCGGFGVRPSST